MAAKKLMSALPSSSRLPVAVSSLNWGRTLASSAPLAGSSPPTGEKADGISVARYKNMHDSLLEIYNSGKTGDGMSVTRFINVSQNVASILPPKV